MIELTVLRDIFTEQSVTSEVLYNGTQLWFGIEPPNRPVRPCCIESGRYKVALQPSAHFVMTVPCVQDVPNHTGIEIHPGNFPSNTHGCLCIGEERGPDTVTASRDAFNDLMSHLSTDPDNIWITYVGGQTQ